MSFTQMLDVAIGLALIYFYLSLFTSGAVEAVASAVGGRFRMLKVAVGNMLDAGNPNVMPGAPTTLTDAVFSSGAVKSLMRPNGLLRMMPFRAEGPSYMPSRVFSGALLDALQTGEARHNWITTAGLAVERLEPGTFRSTLQCLLDDSGGDSDRLRQSIELWFDDVMERASGWYKRQTQLFLLIGGLAVAIALNVDSIRIVKFLWNEEAARSELVVEAAAIVEQNAEASGLTDEEIQNLANAFTDVDIPMGLPLGPDQTIWFAILGWLVTAAAISLGSEFWFRGLKSLMSIRAAGPEPAKAAPPAAAPAPAAPVAGPATPVPVGYRVDGPSNDYELRLSVIDLKDLQTVLGLPPDYVTGRFNEPTRNAIGDFERQNNLAITNELDANLVAKIMAI